MSQDGMTFRKKGAPGMDETDMHSLPTAVRLADPKRDRIAGDVATYLAGGGQVQRLKITARKFKAQDKVDVRDAQKYR